MICRLHRGERHVWKVMLVDKLEVSLSVCVGTHLATKTTAGPLAMVAYVSWYRIKELAELPI